MPNHVINELTFRGVDPAQQDAIIAKLCGSPGEVDLEALVPVPLNMWWGSVGQQHEKAFKRTRLSWATENWGTKWNAYSHQPTVRTDSSITFTFETAWRPPYPWLAAVFNSLGLSFDHNWLNEGGESGCGVFDASKRDQGFSDPWTEQSASESEQKRLYSLLYGDDEDAA